MDTYECIKTRRSVRKYKNKEVAWDLVAKVIDAGRLAPSAGNLQNWKFIAVRDIGKRAKIAEACLKQDWMAKAPVHIVIVGEIEPAERYYGTRGDRLYSIQNCAAAAENMLLQAHNLGLGACWVGAFDENMVGRVVGLPPELEVRPQVVITLGYADEEPREPSKYPLENVTYFEGWRGKIRDVPGYAHYYSLKWPGMIESGKNAVKKGAKKIAETAKNIAQGKKEGKEDKEKELVELERIYGKE